MEDGDGRMKIDRTLLLGLVGLVLLALVGTMAVGMARSETERLCATPVSESGRTK